MSRAERKADVAIRLTDNPPESLAGKRVDHISAYFEQHKDIVEGVVTETE